MLGYNLLFNYLVIITDKRIVGSLRIGKVLGCSNFFGMVSGGFCPKYAENVGKVMKA